MTSWLRSTTVAAVVLAAFSPGMPAQAASPAHTYQCWTDERGVRACGDHVPPQYAKGEREVVDQQGKITKVLPRERTAAEQAEFQRQEEARKQAEAEQQRQAAYDGFLLQSYQNVGEIERTRNDRLSSIDGRTALVEKAQESTEASLTDLRQRAASQQGAGKPVSPELDKQIRSFEKARGDNIAALARLKDERVQTAEQFRRDIERYRSLRGLPPSSTPPSPPSSPPPPPQ